jgi:hypothetical protein
MANFRFQGVHLTGSLPFTSAEETLRWIGQELKPWVGRVPDGEPGERASWVLSEKARFFENDAFEPAPPEAGSGRQRLRLKAGVKPDQITFQPLSYPRHARSSFESFQKAKADGRLRGDARFLVSLPTPFNAVSFFVTPEDQPAVLAAYEHVARRALEEILALVPHSELSIQWDLPIELTTFQGWFPNPFGTEDKVLETVATVGRWVPPRVDLGFHFCYGDSKFGPSPFMGTPHSKGKTRDEGRHIVPEDASVLVKLANALTQVVPRAIHFLQLATMRGWDEPRHWEALAALDLRPETQVYLGLVHASDGIEGALARLELASRYLRSFGVSTECGLGRHSLQELGAVVAAFRELGNEPGAPRA